VFRELNDGSFEYEPEYSITDSEVPYDETCTPADQADPSSICRLLIDVDINRQFTDTRMLYIMVSSTAAVDAGDIQLTIAPVSSKTNCPPLDGVQGVVFQDALLINQYITCLYPFGAGTRSQAVAKCASFTGATLPWPRSSRLGSLSTPHSNAMSLIARIVGMTDSDKVWMLGSRPCTVAEPCAGFTGGWTPTLTDLFFSSLLNCPSNGQGCAPWLAGQPST
jgi:hypothetical protein